jgi:hypothetical protein
MKEMAIDGGERPTGLEMFDFREHRAVISGDCLCQWHDARDWTGRAAHEHCRGLRTEIGRATPISVPAVCHSQTIYQWRGLIEPQHYNWITENHDWTWGQQWNERWDGYCAMTLLWYRFWRTMNDRTDTEEMPIDPREYSLVRQLKEGSTYSDLRKMLRDATGEEHACLKLLRPAYTCKDIVRAIIAAN